MTALRRGADRGVTRVGWLDARHSFSFGDYFDPARHHYRALRVLNEDRVAPGGGFDTHGHRDMEILTTVLAGQLQHRDSMGNGEVIRPGEWQGMTAGTGILHSEFNPSADEPTHLLQIWLTPDRKGHTPAYRQKPFAGAAGAWQLVASPDGAEGSLPIHADARLYQARLTGEQVRHELVAGRGAYVHLATGTATVNGQALAAGDAVTVEGEAAVEVTGDGTVLLFDLA
ncbi:pirin family protein [Urbifossiella limnaea]|uniref:Quercetin 2,3-dioxygenase n=1 Tax=Urbifossiella limnaea TaxID=2528023 RepID=A0A517XPX9_9BACT|nr:pirin family protein [Urbifossiella limnaea]QDU19552.1 Quercetin 2,3-dioxygenase [Urbifossiella limnaea]